MNRLAALLATTGMLLAVAPAGQALASTTSRAPVNDAYDTPGNQIKIVGRPRLVAPEPQEWSGNERNTSSVTVSYSCAPTSANVQIGARVRGPAPDHSNRWARFGYPFTPAVCDGKRHVRELLLTAYYWDDPNFVRGDVVSVGVDLIEYELVEHVGYMSTAALAGNLLANVKITGGANTAV